jgi:hypothetical protein
MAIAAVPYSFENYPNGAAIPLAQLDANFNYLTTNIGGNLTITPAMLSAGGPTWDATGKLVSQGNLITGSGNITSLTYPTNILNIGLNGFTFNVGTSTPVQMTTAGAKVNGSLKITQVTPAGVLTLNAPNVGINTSFTFPPSMGYSGYVLTTDGAGNTAWIAPANLGVNTFSTGTTGLTANGLTVATTGNIVLGGILKVANGGTGTSALPGNGYILIGNGTGYTLNTLTAGPNCTITNAAGSITIDFNSVVAGVTKVSCPTTVGLQFAPQVGNAVLDGILNISNGGTGASSQQLALNNLVGGVTNGAFLRGNGVNIVLAPLVLADVTALGTLTNPIASTGAVSATGNITATGTVTATGNISTSGTITATSTATASDFLVATKSIKSIGIGQTWQDLTASRVLGTTYVNTSGRPIMIMVSVTYVSVGSTATLTVGGVTIASSFNGFNEVFSTIVPDATSYAVSSTGTVTLTRWVELR